MIKKKISYIHYVPPTQGDIIHAFFSLTGAIQRKKAFIVRQPNDNHILVTHWTNNKQVINNLKMNYPDLTYVGEAFFENNPFSTNDFETNPNKQIGNK